MQPIHLFRDEIVEYGMIQYRISAVRSGILLHTVIRWSEMSANHAMQKWLANSINLNESDQHPN